MLRRLDIKLVLSLTFLIVAISCIRGDATFRMHKQRLVETMVAGADPLSRSITSATWHAMLADDRISAYQIMGVIADKRGVDRIRLFNREGQLMFSTDSEEMIITTTTANEVCLRRGRRGIADKERGQNQLRRLWFGRPETAWRKTKRGGSCPPPRRSCEIAA